MGSFGHPFLEASGSSLTPIQKQITPKNCFKIGFWRISSKLKKVQALILLACRSFPVLIYASKSLHYYPRTSPKATGSLGHPSFGSIQVKLHTHIYIIKIHIKFAWILDFEGCPRNLKNFKRLILEIEKLSKRSSSKFRKVQIWMAEASHCFGTCPGIVVKTFGSIYGREMRSTSL